MSSSPKTKHVEGLVLEENVSYDDFNSSRKSYCWIFKDRNLPRQECEESIINGMKELLSKQLDFSQKNNCFPELDVHPLISAAKFRVKTEKALFASGSFSDVNFIVLDEAGFERKVAAHKYVLASRSSVFYAMFCGGLKEEKSDITVEDISYEVFESMLQYIYTGDVEINKDLLTKVVYAAKKYDIVGLEDACVTLLESQVTPDNALTFLKFAIKFDCARIQSAVLKKITEHPIIVETHEFCELPKDCLKFLVHSDELKLEEVKVFNIVMKWAEYQKYCKRDERKLEEIVDSSILREIRFPLMSLQDFCSNVVNVGVLGSSEINDMFCYFAFPHKGSMFFSRKCRSCGRQCTCSKGADYYVPCTGCKKTCNCKPQND